MSVVNIKWSKKRLTIGVKIGIIHKNDCMCMTGLGSGLVLVSVICKKA